MRAAPACVPGPTNTSPSAPMPVPRAQIACMSSTDQSAGVQTRPSSMTKSLPIPASLRPAGRLDAAEPGHEPEARDLPHRLADDGLVHFALPLGSIDEHDRYFAELEPFSPCANAHLDLEGIPVGSDLR